MPLVSAGSVYFLWSKEENVSRSFVHYEFQYVIVPNFITAGDIQIERRIMRVPFTDLTGQRCKFQHCSITFMATYYLMEMSEIKANHYRTRTVLLMDPFLVLIN